MEQRDLTSCPVGANNAECSGSSNGVSLRTTEQGGIKEPDTMSGYRPICSAIIRFWSDIIY